MTDPDEDPPYIVEPDADRFRVRDRGGRVILVCGDSANAEHYAALLSAAFRSGFDAGFRRGRRSRD